MKTTLALTAAAALGFFQAGSTTFARPINTQGVPDSSSWVIHVDVDALRDSSIGKLVLEELNKPEMTEQLAMVKTMIGMDPRTALHGITLFGTAMNDQDGVAVIDADLDVEQLKSLAGTAKGHTTSTNGTHEIHHWGNENGG